MKRKRAWAFLAGLLLALPAPAQEIRSVDPVQATGTAYYQYARRGEVTLQVLVMGNVGRPGVYIVGRDTALDELLALSGSTLLGADLPTETQRVTVRLFRPEGDRRVLVYEAAMETLLTEPGRYPALQDGDVVAVESLIIPRRRFTWRDGLSLATSLATLVILATQLADVFRN